MNKVVFLGMFLFLVGCSVSDTRLLSATSYIVPLYSYPGDSYYSGEWDKLLSFDSRGKVVDVIVNVDNGPGNSKDQNFDDVISRLFSKGFRVIGYVYSSYANRSIDSVKYDIDNWFEIYGVGRVKGIFIDEVSTRIEDFEYYSNVVSYIKERYGSDKVVIFNPGTTVGKEHFGIADKVVVFESPYEVFKDFRYGDYSGVDSDRVCTIVLGISDRTKLEEVKSKAIDNGSSCLYLTSQFDDGSRDSAYFVVSGYMINHEF